MFHSSNSITCIFKHTVICSKCSSLQYNCYHCPCGADCFLDPDLETNPISKNKPISLLKIVR